MLNTAHDVSVQWREHPQARCWDRISVRCCCAAQLYPLRYILALIGRVGWGQHRGGRVTDVWFDSVLETENQNGRHNQACLHSETFIFWFEVGFSDLCAGGNECCYLESALSPTFVKVLGERGVLNRSADYRPDLMSVHRRVITRSIFFGNTLNENSFAFTSSGGKIRASPVTSGSINATELALPLG